MSILLMKTISWTTYRSSVLLHCLSGKAGCVVDDRREVGGAPELQLREALLVGLNNTLNPWLKKKRESKTSAT